MLAASHAPTTPSATPASTSPSTSPTRNARAATSRTRGRSCCVGRCSRRRCRAARAGSPDHAYYLQVAERIDHNRACLSVARKLCRRAYHLLRELGDEVLAPVDGDRYAEEAIAAAA